MRKPGKNIQANLEGELNLTVDVEVNELTSLWGPGISILLRTSEVSACLSGQFRKGSRIQWSKKKTKQKKKTDRGWRFFFKLSSDFTIAKMLMKQLQQENSKQVENICRFTYNG